MNEQSKLLWQWRSKILALLTQKLSCGDDEASGDEYARTLETQGEAETYLQAYTALMADYREVLVAERTLLAAHDYREKKKRRTKAAMKAEMGNWEARLLEEEEDVIEDVELGPEHEVLKKELDTERKELLGQFEGRAVKSVVADLTGVLAKLPKVDSPERAIAQSGVIRLRQLIASQRERNCSHC
jgi:E3 ubiquitin-protein ligase SHPRH